MIQLKDVVHSAIISLLMHPRIGVDIAKDMNNWCNRHSLTVCCDASGMEFSTGKCVWTIFALSPYVFNNKESYKNIDRKNIIACGLELVPVAQQEFIMNFFVKLIELEGLDIKEKFVIHLDKRDYLPYIHLARI